MLEAKMPPSVPAVSPSCELCRLCARRNGDICIFSRHRGNVSLSQQAMLVASLKIVPEDGLPHVVCHACAARLSRCFMFRQRARRAQRRLRDRSTYSTDTAPPDCGPDSDGGNSYTQSAPAGDLQFSDDDHEPENIRIDSHDCSKNIPNDNNRLSINNHITSNSSSKNALNNYCSSKNNEIGYSENDNSHSESSTNKDKNCPESLHKKDKSCHESSHKNDKSCHESSHKKDKNCLESSNNKDKSCFESLHKNNKDCHESSRKKDKSCHESSHKKNKGCHENSHKKDKSCQESSHKKNKSYQESSDKNDGCTDIRNKKKRVNKITVSNCKKSKRKCLNSEHKRYSKLNQNESILDTAINKSVLNDFLENDINELLSDKKITYKSETSENSTNCISSNILFNALQKHSDCDSFTKECKTEKNTEKKKGIDESSYICEHGMCKDDAFRIEKDVCSIVISRQNKDNDIKDFVKSITKETEVDEDVTSSNELVYNDDEVKATRSCDETGDSEGAVIRYRRDSWCESDEEKLLHTALKMSIVRHSQDWEIKRETEACNTELMDTSELALNAMTAHATQLKLKVRDDLYADSPGAPASSDLVAEEKEVVEKKKSYQCQLCNESFGVKSLLKKHLSTCWLQIGDEKRDEKEEGKNKQQDDSGVPLARGSHKGLRGVQKKEKSKRKKDRKCKVCGDVFSGRYQLLVHRRSPCAPVAPATALREHMCEVCGRTFKQRTVLLQHMGTHSGLKLFTCPLCPKTFTRGAHVHVHMRIHNNVKPFVCETCGRSFTKSSDLLRHRRVHSDARDFPCPLCHKAFKRSGDVASHMRTHSGQRPYKCEPCCKSYTCHSSLLKHRRNKCALRRPSPPAPCSPRDDCPREANKNPATSPTLVIPAS